MEVAEPRLNGYGLFRARRLSAAPKGHFADIGQIGMPSPDHFAMKLGRRVGVPSAEQDFVREHAVTPKLVKYGLALGRNGGLLCWRGERSLGFGICLAVFEWGPKINTHAPGSPPIPSLVLSSRMAVGLRS